MGKNNSGDKNQNSLLTSEEVFKIRKYYVGHSLRETYEKYGQKYKSKCSFRRVLDRSYNNIPIYSKIKKQ